MARLVEITGVILRDVHQSLMATRMGIDDMIPACEDPWERLRTFRKLLPNTRLQMLLREQNLLGYRHYEDSVVHRFVE